jgi:ferrous iron transport protein B
MAHSHTTSPTTTSDDRSPLILVGNPNVGKSAIFGFLTGSYVNVSNYPGTTVEVTRGSATLDNDLGTVIDTPGANSLTPMSEDELVTRSILLDTIDAPVLQVADMKNLRRALVITAQLSDLERHGGLALNMADEASGRGISVDFSKLTTLIGVDVKPTVAVRKSGVQEIAEQSLAGDRFSLRIEYSDEIEQAISEISDLLPDDMVGRRGIALMILAGDETVAEWLSMHVSPEILQACDAARVQLQSEFSVSLGSVISLRRLSEIDRLLTDIMSRQDATEGKFLRVLSGWSMHRYKGLLVVAVVLYITLWFVGLLGAGTGVDFLETVVFGRYVNPAAIWLVDHALPFPHEHAIEVSEYTLAIPLSLIHEWEIGTSITSVTATDYELLTTSLTFWQTVFRHTHDFIVGPYGLVTMALSYGFAIVMPIVFTFFILFSILEDSGYLPRLAVMTNRFFRMMGLNGKAVLPMVLGLGCDTMATMTARILETKKERVITTLLLALGVPCSAQLGVIMAMVASISLTGMLWWAGMITLVMVAVGWLASKVLPGGGSDLVLELPPLRTPQIGNIVIKTIARIEWYLKEVVPLFMLGTAVLFVLNISNSLGAIQQFASPVVQDWLGLPAQATEAFLLGFLRRDYGAAGLLVLQQDGLLNEIQVIVSLVTITLFVPCIANVFVIAKERGVRTAVWMTAFIFPFAFFIGGVVRYVIIASNTMPLQ